MISKEQFSKKQIKFEIINHLGVLSERKDWKKELNVISWNEGQPKFDIREWNEEHTQMSKGITLSFDELEALKKIIDAEIDFSE